MRNLRTQLLFSHLVLVALLMIVMGGAAVNFVYLGRAIDRILKDNYRSVIAAQNMKEALERQDSAAIFFLAGQGPKAQKQYEANVPLFREAYLTETHNITEPGEQQLAEELGRDYTAYRQEMEKMLYSRPALPSAAAQVYYSKTLEPASLRIKQRAQKILDLNQSAILRANVRAKQESRRASVTSVAMTLSALLTALLFVTWTTRAALSPLRSLARQAEEIGVGHLNQRIELNRSDEIGALALSFNQMTEKLREAKRREEERLHRAERMSDAALESLYDAVIVTDAEGRVVHLNPAAENLYGPAILMKSRLVSQVVQEKRIAEAVHHAIHQERISAAEDEAGFITRQEGEIQRTYRLRATPMRDEEGVLLGAVAVLEDMTHLRELDRLKTEFIGVASHELRTPVQSLLLSVQLLEEGAIGELTPEQKEIIAAQREDLNRLERMMRDLLDITRLEAGVTPTHMETIPPCELCHAALQVVEAQAKSKQIRIEIRPDADRPLPPVRVDRNQINRVLVNLLNNAIRHSPSGGSVTVETEQAGNFVRFRVTDEGTGIPKEYLSHIFERFVQVPGANRGGAGLGLSIAKTIVLAHGGEISAESRPDSGAVFNFTLPSAPIGIRLTETP